MEVTYTYGVPNPEVMYETAVKHGFKTMTTDINGNVLSNKGYSPSEVTFNMNFTKQNRDQILSEIREGWFDEPHAQAI
jgi:hypothetical protein